MFNQEKNKKLFFIFAIFFLVISFPVSINAEVIEPESENNVTLDECAKRLNPSTGKPLDPGECYQMTAPLPGIGDDKGVVEFTGKPGAYLGDYVNKVVTLLIGLIGIAAVIMLVFAGVQHMMTGSIITRGKTKKLMTDAIFGLLLALSIFLILNTINRDLLKLNPDVDVATIEGNPDIGNPELTDEQQTAKDFVWGNSTPALAEAFENGCGDGTDKEIKSITVMVAPAGVPRQQSYAYVNLANGDSIQVPVGTGYGGPALPVPSNGVVDSGTTPTGTFNLGGRKDWSNDTDDPVMSLTGNPKSNLGAGFMGISGMEPRAGIGIHGDSISSTTNTAGCIKFSNADLALLQSCEAFNGSLPLIITAM
jgi:hypothetical protein